MVVHLHDPTVLAKTIGSPLNAQSTLEVSKPTKRASHTACAGDRLSEAKSMRLKLGVIEASALAVDRGGALEEGDHGSVELNRSWFSHALELTLPSCADYCSSMKE